MRLPSSQFLSLLLHAGAVFAMLHVTALLQLPRNQKQPIVDLTSTRLIWHLPPVFQGNSRGGGSGKSLLPPSRGELPKVTARQIVIPTVQRPDHAPLLPVEPTLEGVPLAQQGPVLHAGDPTAVPGPPSDGAGGRKGIGTGGSGGVGNRSGPSTGDGEGGSVTGQSYTRLSTQPVALYRVEPEFTEEARKARLQGVVVLRVDIDEQGQVSHIRVEMPLGLGLDEKAIEAVKLWRFRPATRDGRPVRTPAIIEVSFRLL